MVNYGGQQSARLKESRRVSDDQAREPRSRQAKDPSPEAGPTTQEVGAMIPTDRETVTRDLIRLHLVPTAEDVRYETRVRELENEGLTRSDAQGVADCEFRSTKR